ncbi:MAG: response regulator transcription factor [Gammaproteobacteria bacterium]|nr:response regulator transcription factor [Gammaproteobacteria bacterium]
MKILIVDDEAPARMRLRAMIDEIGDYKIVGEAANGKEALELTESTLPDIVLLDIRMPLMDGLETARHLLVFDIPPAVIFTTAYNQYALEAFETNAVDYLMKPIRKEKLESTLQKLQRLNKAQLSNLKIDDTDENIRTHLCTRLRGNLQLIPVTDITYFQADQKYVTVCHKNGEALIEESLKSLEDEFTEQFIRIHRNALVKRDSLTGMEKSPDGSQLAVMKDTENRLEISRRHLPEIRKLLKG